MERETDRGIIIKTSLTVGIRAYKGKILKSKIVPEIIMSSAEVLGSDKPKHVNMKLKKSGHEKLVLLANINSRESSQIDAVRVRITFVCSTRKRYAPTVLRILGIVGHFFSKGLYSYIFLFLELY